MAVEVADVDAVTVRIDANCSFPSVPPKVEVYRQAKAQSLYPLPPVFYLEAFLEKKISTRNKQEVKSLSFSHTT
ncbi:hypothetical protein COU13_01570 [Candidatus Kaiserbacteria bacterium CG10_big_fil_rev_8_21_14_0_10_43_70]|uniref:Uncharacterized protein n=1 Tax=Candidatus Kaiserbacteria bacterium CG10_big_fil_rev_8_21_14_0_10_43_70 TaxID=1974605 RepID=A0A2H0UIU4_9BACT|nr:MAG: hypothetical protein COU13_01570 [Candidatus Kaiserbacteria bacterium CG10_big_fil_rev_8_21_14_0_10_43_70]